MATIGKNQFFEIKNGDGSSFHNLVLRKSAVESIVMSLGDKISGDVYYKDNTLSVTMHEYITYNGVNYMLVNPPTIVKEGIVSDNSELKGMTKYSFVFYHPMCLLSNFPFTDVAVTSDETRYLSESKVFSWIGKPADFVAKMNKNLVGTEWIVELSSRFPQDKLNELSDVIPFDNATIADACKTFYDTWGVPYVVDKVASTEASYAAGKRFKLVMGLPSNEIYENAQAEQQNTPFVFQMGQGVGLKNNSRTPRNNKIITRISGYGSENNIPYGYPQVRWYGTAGQAFTYGDHAGVYNNVTIEGVHFDKIISYPIYKGILDGEYVELIKHPFTRTHLMPSVYRTTLFNKISFYDAAGEANTDYDPDITLVDYYDAVYSAQYPYPNTINLQAPSYESHEFEDEKPELGEAHIISATPLNNDLTPASSWDDSLDDEGNYKQSYFQMVLPQLSFDLYACASITEEMQINMRSGACLGCTFTVQVDWDDYKRNFYDEDGNFAPNGSQRDLTKYPKSDQGSIALVLQKDNSTFGTLMPNMYQYPKGETSTGAADGDTFVILGISLPESYIFAAEWRLDADMKSYMLENNVHYFDYPLKFDEDFLFHKEYILSQIRPNTVVRFNYAGQTQALFVKQITVKYGEQPLPQYDITLTDNVEVVLNQIGQVAEDVEKLSTLIAILRQSYGKNVWNELAKKLSKTQNDTAAGYITMLKGLQVGANFVPDILGEGGVLRMREDGKVELVTDILYARMKAYFDTVEVREYQHTGGNRIASVAGNRICRVEWYDANNQVLEQTQANLSSVAYFRCYFRASDGEDTVRNNWVVGDLAYCHVTSIANSSDNPEAKGANQKHLWRLVIGRNTDGILTEDGEAYIDLSNRTNETISGASYTGYQSGSDAPEAQDDIIQLGNVNDTTRQGAIVEFVTGTDAPSYQIYQGINSFSLNGKNQIGFGYNTSTGRAYLNVYGDFRFGARPNTQGSYLEYNSQTGALNIKAHVEFTNSDQELNALVQSHQRDDRYDDSWIQPALDELQGQIDGQIDSWFYNYSPVHVDAQGAPDSTVPLNVEPYSDWDTDDKKIAHLGDTFTNNTTGYCWRFSRNSETNAFEWVIIEDSAVITALQNAARAQETADGKRTTYSVWGAWVKNNVNTLKTGDLFIPAADTTEGGVTYKARKVYKCTTDGSATFSEINYTDDTYAHNFDYLKAAMKGDTQIQGGLLLSNAVVLRNVEQGVSTDIMSGINGVLNTDLVNPLKSIAAWYGGDMLDREAASDSSSSSSEEEEEPRYAKSLLRFDGSGYLASGNITWDATGRVTIKDLHTDDGGTPTDVLQEMSAFRGMFDLSVWASATRIKPLQNFEQLKITRPSGYTITDSDVVTYGEMKGNFITKTWFNKFFKVHYKNNGTDAVLDPNNDFPAGATDKNIEAIFSFWTNYAISALGQGVDGSHAIGVLDDLSDVTITNPAADQILKFDGTHWVNAAAPQTYVLPKATTSALGGIIVSNALGSQVTLTSGAGTTANRYYGVQIDSVGQAFVNIPWTDTTYTLAGLMGSTAIGGTTQPIYWNGSAFANTTYTLGKSVPSDAVFTDHTYTNGTGLALSSGTFSINSTYQTYISHGESAYNSLSSYLLLSGGTMTGTLTTPKIRINTLHSSESKAGGIYYYNGTTDYLLIGQGSANLWIGANETSGTHHIGSTYISAGEGSAYISRLVSGTRTNYEIIDAGNIGSQSVNYATSAGKLSTVSKTAWGRTYWTAGGVPDSISGALESVTNISMSGYIKIGSIYIGEDSNGDLEIYKLSNGSHVAANLYARGGVSALGQSSSGGGGGGQGDVTWELLVQSDTRQINISHLAGDANYAGVMSILTGYTTSGKNYAVQKDSSNHLYVNVPWTDTTYDLSGYLPRSGGNMTGSIGYAGSLATNTMITFINNTTDAYGNGIAIGGGGLTIIGGGESASVIAAQHTSGGDENMCIGNDGSIDFYSNLQYGWSSRKEMSFSTDGNLYIGGSKVWTESSLTNNNQLINGAGYVTSSGVTSIATGTGLTGGTITTTGTISINSTYQTYISHGESAYNSLGNYLPKSGGTMTGTLYTPTDMYNRVDGTGGGIGAIHLNNSDITGVNAILMNDPSEDWHESLAFIRSDGKYDTIRAYNGTLYFGINSGASEYTVLHSGNSSVSLSGSTLSVKINGSTQSLTNTWRGIQDNLTSSTNTTESLSAKQGYLLANGSARDNTKLPVSGGTLTGNITLPYGLYVQNSTYGLNCNNSDIINVNGIYTADLADSYAEGYCFKRTNGNYDSFRANDGVFYFGANNGSENVRINPNRNGVGNGSVEIYGTYHFGLLMGSGLVNRGIYSFKDDNWMLYFNASNTILNYGSVGVGTTSPAYKLDINGSLRNTTSACFCTTSGNVGIGTASPSYKLHVNGESYFADWMFVNSSVTALGIELQPSSSSAGHGGHIDFHYNRSSADYTTRLIESASGQLKLIGDFYATGGVTALVATSSDIRKKNVVSYDLPLTLNQIADAPTIKFTWKDNAQLGEQVGSIAQYWQKVLPQTIRTEKDNTLSLQYGVAALVATITTARKVVDHEKRISELERERDAWKEAYSFLERAYNELKLMVNVA